MDINMFLYRIEKVNPEELTAIKTINDLIGKYIIVSEEQKNIWVITDITGNQFIRTGKKVKEIQSINHLLSPIQLEQQKVSICKAEIIYYWENDYYIEYLFHKHTEETTEPCGYYKVSEAAINEIMAEDTEFKEKFEYGNGKFYYQEWYL